jgi:V/A-type H+-transporting ATPase subunit I
VLVSGWLPAESAPTLEKLLQEVTVGRCALSVTEPADAEDVPVLLRQPRVFRPFANLVNGFGLPKYREVSPTFFVAVSYLLMFGMMFGDVGHGLVLALAGLGALWFTRRRDIGVLLLCAGMVSAAFGWVYGSCFGLEWFKQFALWRDPLEGSPLDLLRIALGVGVAMISLGVVLNIINRFRQHDPVGAILDKFGIAGLVFYWGMLLWVTGQVRGSVWMALPVVAWVLKAPLERHAGETGWFASAVEAFEGVVLYLANTISFVRLAAYAMSHAALLMAALAMAHEIQRTSPAAGWLVIVAGNAAAIVLEGIIAAVQALRLEYYEFFNKFFPGEGRPFEPFRLQSLGLGGEEMEV